MEHMQRDWSRYPYNDRLGKRVAPRIYGVGWHIGHLLTRIFGSLFKGLVRGVKTGINETQSTRRMNHV
jgi:hypothetical protein